jgi:flagellar hook assembly protein FlgD
MNVFHPLFGETLSVRVELCKANWFSFNIYNTAGERVRSLKPGGPGDAYSSEEQHMVWDGKNDRGEWVSSGVYILYGEGGRFSDRRLVVLLR